MKYLFHILLLLNVSMVKSIGNISINSTIETT